MSAARAVVFAYHGVRCLRTLLAHGVDVALVVTHADAPGETIWFDSVARHARWHGLRVVMPEDPNAPAMLQLVRSLQPDFLFSFYYRSLLKPELLALAARGAYNMHGSLLPKYRGRVPVNWAVLHGERETGASLHVMTAKPDAGAIVDAQAVPILPDDTAVEVFRKVTVAAEIALHRCLPGLLAGTACLTAQDLAAGSYFGRRTARDGVIDWSRGVQAVHNLVRAVAPPYPGAFGKVEGLRLRVLRTLPLPGLMPPQPVTPSEPPAPPPATLRWLAGELYVFCHDGALKLLEFELGADIADAEAFHRRFGDRVLTLEPVTELE